MKDFSSIDSINWKHIIPDENNDWINKRNKKYSNFIQLYNEKKSFFTIDTSGVTTARDSWVYNFSKERLLCNIKNMVDVYNSDIDNIKLNSFTNIDLDVNNGCQSYLGDPKQDDTPAYYLQFAFNIIKYAAIILLFVFTITDFIKAIASSDDKAIKKALQNAIKRIIIAIIIFFLPILIEFVLSLLGIYGDCGIE